MVQEKKEAQEENPSKLQAKLGTMIKGSLHLDPGPIQTHVTSVIMKTL